MSGKAAVKKNYFVTGTDTDVGKTLICEALLLKAKQQGLRTVGLKPIAAGAYETVEGLRNDDALRLQAAATEKLSYAQINPVLFTAAIAPHIAAAQENRRVTIASLTGYVRGAMMHPADFRIIEGAGGWHVPVNNRELLGLLPKALGIDVIIVVGLKLGCINHALLTIQAVRQSGVNVAAWVATQIDPNMANINENIESLKYMLGAPFLGFVPYNRHITAEFAAQHIELP